MADRLTEFQDALREYAMACLAVESAVNYQELVRAEKWAQQQFERLTQMFIEAGKAGEGEQCQQQS